jgi:hypothetical protein
VTARPERAARARISRIALLVAALAGCGDGTSDGRTWEHIASEACPLRTPAHWQAFLETTAANERFAETCSDDADCAERFGDVAARVRDEVLGTLELCSEDLARNPRIARCSERLRRFVPAWLSQHAPGSYGFAPSNAAYFAAQERPDLPEGMTDPPAELLAALPERAAIEAAARENGWPYVTHDSGLGSVRTFMAVADASGRFDQWLLVTLDPSETFVPDPSVLSLIAVQKRDSARNPLPRVRLHFRDYLVARGEDTWQLSLPEEREAKCYACHGSGLRLLVPSAGNVLASAPVRGEPEYGAGNVPDGFAKRRLRELNERLLAYGPPDWNGALDPADHGPPLGESLGCTACHDGQTRGSLTVSTSELTVAQKMVEQLSMRSYRPGQAVPDENAMALLEREQSGDPPLSAEERRALDLARDEHLEDYQAFVAFRFPSLRAWLLEASCE